MAVSTGVSSKVSIGGSAYCFASFEDSTTQERVFNPSAICGSRDPIAQRVSTGRRLVQFQLTHDATRPILDQLLSLAGTTRSGSGTQAAPWVYTANESVATTEICVDKVASKHRYTACRLQRLVLRGQVGTMPVQAESTWIATDEIEDPAFTFADGTVDNLLAFPGATLTVGGTEAAHDRYAIVIDNRLTPSWNASETVTDVGPGPRQVLLAFACPYITANKDHYWTNRVVTPRALTHRILNGNDSLTFSMGYGVLVPQSPSIQGATEEVRLNETWEAYRSGNDPAFTFSLYGT